jgi:hypothetical protein
MITKQCSIKVATALMFLLLESGFSKILYKNAAYAQYSNSPYCESIVADAQRSKQREAASKDSLRKLNQMTEERMNRIRAFGVRANKLYNDGQLTSVTAYIDQIFAVLPGQIIVPSQRPSSKPNFLKTPFLDQLLSGIDSIIELNQANKEMKSILRQVLNEKAEISINEVFINVNYMEIEKEQTYRSNLLSQYKQRCTVSSAYPQQRPQRPNTISMNGKLVIKWSNTSEAQSCESGNPIAYYSVQGGATGKLFMAPSLCQQYFVTRRQEIFGLDVVDYIFIDTNGSERCTGRVVIGYGGLNTTSIWKVDNSVSGFQCSKVGREFKILLR